jgi:threonine synthase
LTLKAVRESSGDAQAIAEEQIRAATRQLASCSGIDAAPEGGCALAVAAQLAAEGRLPANSEVVVYNTGSGASYRA